jgi:hypothetical protein
MKLHFSFACVHQKKKKKKKKKKWERVDTTKKIRTMRPQRERERERERERVFLPMISLLSQSASILPAALVHTPTTLFASLLSKTDYGLCVSSDLEQHLFLPPADRNFCCKRV